MQKIKLFMVLTLLCVGVSGVWGSVTYRVVYENVPSGASGNFTITNSYIYYGQDSESYYAFVHATKGSNASTLTLSYAYLNNNRYSDYNNPSWYGLDESDLRFRSSNETTYITYLVDYYIISNITRNNVNYIGEISVSNTPTGQYVGTITIKYRENKNVVFYTWTSSPADIKGDVELLGNKTISYTYNSLSYTSKIGGPTKLTSGENAIYVEDVPFHQYTYEDTYNYTRNIPYSVTSYDPESKTYSGTPGPLSTSNINNYVKPKEVDGYSATISAVEFTGYSNTFNFVITYTPTIHSIYYSVQYNATAPASKGFSLKTTTLDAEKSNTTLSLSGTTITASNPPANSYIPKLINWSNVDDVISATQIEGYTTKVIVSGGKGTQADPYIITINYTNGWAPEGSDLAYSTFHVESTGHQYSLPDGQVAVSLNLTPSAPHYAEETITDIISFSEAKATEMGLTLTKGASTTVDRDDDGDGVGTTTTYVSKGQWGHETNDMSDDDYYFERTHTVAVNTATQLTIPNTVELGGREYTVTAIQKWGFAYSASDQNDIWYCKELENSEIGILDRDPVVSSTKHDNINDHRNDYLQKITFDSECPITSFGDYCFMSNNKLGEITIPKNVEYLGTGVFECCQSLKNVYFQRNKNYGGEYTEEKYPDGYTKIKTILLWTFWHCTALESIEFPDGITEIQGTSLGSPLQYVFALINVRLPNTLEKIGPHFLCDAMSLKTLTIPASVTYINGACFHGCESLETVYLMGPASTLDINAEAGDTFDSNASYCGEHVQNCKFLTSSEYLGGYQESASWSVIDEQGKTDGTTYTNAKGNTIKCIYGNSLGYIPDTEVELTKDKWVTIIFPYGLSRTDLVNKIGAGTMVAKMTKATRDKEADPNYMYHLTFTLIDTSEGIPAKTPYMICAEKTGKVPLYTAAQASSSDFLSEATKLHAVTVEADDAAGEPKAMVAMNGQYNPYLLHPWDFYFMYDKRAIPGTDHLGDGKGKFWRVRYQADAPTVGGCKCYWSVWYDGIKQQIGGAKPLGTFFGDDVDAISNVENVKLVVDGIYDLQGRKLNVSQENLPQGLYIVNGKKVVVK